MARTRWITAIVLSLLAWTAQAQNLIVNGSFEEPWLPDGYWNIFWSIPGWTTTSGCGIEIEPPRVVTTAFDGRQLVELDSWCSSSMVQTVPTIPGAPYILSVAYRPRPDNWSNSNDIKVTWDGVTLAVLYGPDETPWAVYSWEVTATGTTAEIGFADVGNSDSYGGFIDDVQLVPANQAPRCDLAQASAQTLWPPNHVLVPVSVVGVTDPESQPVSIAVLGVAQDEPVNGLGDGDVAPDAALDAAGGLWLRAERSGTGDGRVYRVAFQATDSFGASCNGTVTVAVPHDRKGTAVDSGAAFDAFAAQ